MKNINIFYFDNELGDFDEYNPRFVMEQKYAKQIISILSQKVGSFYTKDMLRKALKIDDSESFEHSLKLLCNISAISFYNGKANLSFPFFNANDLRKIKKIVIDNINIKFKSIKNGLIGAKQILKDSYPNIDVKISLYHLVCGKIFDGLMFDYLEKKNLLKQSFHKNQNRDYMIIAYSDEPLCRLVNKKLVCSFNNARSNTNSLTSFGNAQGNRLDYFRYFKLRAINKLYGKFKKIDLDFHDISEQEIVDNSIDIVKKIMNNQSLENSVYLKNLQTMRYVSTHNQLNVPVFTNYMEVLNKLEDSIIKNLGPIFVKSLKDISEQVLNSNIMCLSHKVEKDELTNELWHLYFGFLNNFLIKNKFVAKPKRYFKEGSYLKCVYLLN